MSYTAWILLIPFIMFLVTGLGGVKMKPIVSGILGTCGIGLVAILSYYTAFQYFFHSGGEETGYKAITAFNYVWLTMSDKLHIDMGFMIDPISAMMLVVVSTISLMVHIYSLGYMHGEKGFARFYASLSLFTFSMLGLVVSTNIFQMYVFWELVGASSFLLIGFYYEKPSAVAASKKAFIVTRFADFGFLVGILLISYITGTFDFKELCSPTGIAIAHAPTATFMGLSLINFALLLIYMGGAGKSAMFPLHIWLPDAMEGPTPVSALIHAATMVVAGVYLVARLFPIFSSTGHDALNVVAYVGGFTSLFAAVIACTQIDIKRILAFSTLSQLGYMMLALGVSGYGGHEGLGFMASMFHLFTHAMFKALLFLGAGSIIHAVHSNNLTDMGGLRKYLRWTHLTFLIACLAIAGIPPFAGFWSKDEILVAALHKDKLLFAVEFLVAGLTAFYMFRLYFGVFWNNDRHYHHTPHESPATMLIPLFFLAFASIVAGFVPFHHLVTSDGHGFDSHLDYAVAIPSILFACVGILSAWFVYKKEKGTSDKIAASFKGLYTAALHKFYFDELYLFVTRKIIFRFISTPIAWFDRQVIDGTMNGLGYLTELASQKSKRLQSGQVHQYVFVFVTGAVLLAIAFIYIIVR